MARDEMSLTKLRVEASIALRLCRRSKAIMYNVDGIYDSYDACTLYIETSDRR